MLIEIAYFFPVTKDLFNIFIELSNLFLDDRKRTSFVHFFYQIEIGVPPVSSSNGLANELSYHKRICIVRILLANLYLSSGLRDSDSELLKLSPLKSSK